MKLQMFFLPRNQMDDRPSSFKDAHSFGVPVFKLRLWTLESKYAICAGRYVWRTELSIRRHPYLSELPVAIR